MEIEIVENPKDDVLKGESSLIQVLLSSWNVVGSIKEVALCVLLLALSIVGILLARFKFANLAEPVEIMGMAHEAGVIGVAYAAAILGFLVAGFAVFATVTKPEHFQEIAAFKVNGRKISQFKFVFFNFLNVFTHFIMYILYGMVFCLLFVKHSPAWWVAKTFYPKFGGAVDSLMAVFLSGFIIYSFYSVLLLRGFVWNLYQSLAFAIFKDA
jgi:hypothetical protein